MAVSLSTNPNAVGATITSSGLGTGLDVNTIVPQIVNAEISGPQKRLQTQLSTDQTTISALGAVKSSLSSFQSALQNLLGGTPLNSRTASTSDSAILTATAGVGAVSGNYAVQVNTLASTNTIKSNAVTSASTELGAGNVTLTAGGGSFTVALTSPKDTLSDLRDAINSASDNTGVSATIINAADGAHLLLSSTKTGTANAVSVSSSLLNFSTVTSASDASVSIAGLTYTGSSNVISDAIDGVTLNLVSQSPGTTVNLTVGPDTTTAISAIQSAIGAYNAALSLLNTSTNYNSSTQQGGPLLGDVAIQSLATQLQSKITGNLSSAVSGISVLAQIGITGNSDGTYSVDSTKLTTALQNTPDAVKALVSSSSGVFAGMNTLVSAFVGSGGLIDGEVTGLQSQVTDIQTQLTNLSSRSADLTQMYTNQFNSINTTVSSYNNISSYITQLMTSLNSSKSSGG